MFEFFLGFLLKLTLGAIVKSFSTNLVALIGSLIMLPPLFSFCITAPTRPVSASGFPANLANAFNCSMTSVSVAASLNTPDTPSFCITWFIQTLTRVLVFMSSVSYWLASSPTVCARNSSFCTLESY